MTAKMFDTSTTNNNTNTSDINTVINTSIGVKTPRSLRKSTIAASASANNTNTNTSNTTTQVIKRLDNSMNMGVGVSITGVENRSSKRRSVNTQ